MAKEERLLFDLLKDNFSFDELRILAYDYCLDAYNQFQGTTKDDNYTWGIVDTIKESQKITLLAQVKQCNRIAYEDYLEKAGPQLTQDDVDFIKWAKKNRGTGYRYKGIEQADLPPCVGNKQFPGADLQKLIDKGYVTHIGGPTYELTSSGREIE